MQSTNLSPATIDVEIGGVKYQIGKFKARDGSWILAQILTKTLPAMIEKVFVKEAGATLASNRAVLSEDEFASIQGHALNVCRRYENGMPMPVMQNPDTFAIKEIEYDLTTVIGLTIQALVFNIKPFFLEGGLSQILGLLPAGLIPDQN